MIDFDDDRYDDMFIKWTRFNGFYFAYYNNNKPIFWNMHDIELENPTCYTLEQIYEIYEGNNSSQ